MLWQTALIRLSRLKIQDEIETGLRYYPAAFFEVIPQVNAEVRSALQARWPDAGPAGPADPAARLLDRRRPRRQSERHRRRRAAGHRQRRATPRSRTTSPSSPRSRRNCRCRRGWCTSATGWPRWPTTCHEPARADEPYRRALRVVHGRLTATAAAHPGPPTRARTRAGPAALRHPCGVPGRPRHHRRVAARQRQCAARRRPAGPAAGSRARLRFSSVRPRYAAELRRARGGGRRAAGLGRCASRLRVAARTGPGRPAGRRARHPAAADR